MEQIGSILFIDIETVPLVEKYDSLPENMKGHWEKKYKSQKFSGDPATDAAQGFEDRSGVYSEFAKVVCICIGTLARSENGMNLRLKSLTGDDERKLLADFCEIVHKCAGLYKEFKF